MKIFMRSIPVLLMALGAGAAGAQVSGQYTGAEVLAPNTHLFGGYLDVSNNVVGLMAQLRLSFYPGVDFGFQGGPSRIDVGASTQGTLRLGSDLKVAVHRAASQAPFDAAVGGCLGVETGDNFSLFSIGPTFVISRTFRSGETGGATPYAATSLLFTNIDVGSRSETDFSMPIRLGTEFLATPGLRIVAEMQLRVAEDYRDRTMFSIGVNSSF